jgi:hypothetical protein
MPISLAAPPQSVLAELAGTLPRIARSTSVEERAPSITRAASRFALAGEMRVARSPADIEDADALPVPVYVLGLDDLAQGRLEDGARLALWSHIMTTEAGPISAEVTSEGSQFAQVSNARAAGRARSSLIRMWIRGGRGVLEVLDTQLSELRIGQVYSAEDLAGILRPIAQARLGNPQGEG